MWSEGEGVECATRRDASGCQGQGGATYRKRRHTQETPTPRTSPKVPQRPNRRSNPTSFPTALPTDRIHQSHLLALNPGVRAMLKPPYPYSSVGAEPSSLVSLWCVMNMGTCVPSAEVTNTCLVT